MLSLMTLVAFPTFSKSVNGQTDSKEESEKTEKEKNDEYAECLKHKQCPNDGKSLNDLTEEEQHKAYHCRVQRHLECSMPERNE
jgi:uncharacterized transporter YbjL